MIEIIKLLVITLVLDSIYLGITTEHYKKVIFKIQREKLNMNYLSALLVYLLIVFSIYYFVIRKNMSYKEAFILGFCIYGIFDLTNKSIFNNWGWFSVIIDTLWGGLLYMSVLYIYKKVNKIDLRE